MPRSVATSVENNFSKGLITEVTGVNSPENSVSETINVIYDRKGRALTRKGFKFEDGFVLSAVAQNGVRNEFLWETVSDNNSKTYVVIQFGSIIRFYEVSGNQSLSSGLESFSVDLLSYKTSTFNSTQVANSLCSFTSGKGYLFIAHPNCETLYVKYNEAANSISVNTVVISIRDFEGVVDGLADDTRPTTLSAEHRYNLYNQGWYTLAGDANANLDVQVLDYWDIFRTDYPSNCDVWWHYTKVVSNGLEAFEPATADKFRGFYGNTPAAKGHYIIPALQSNRSTQSGILVSEVSSSGYRPSVVAFYAGRAFYAGIGKSGFSSTIYFTQIIENDTQLSRCYQTNDPTSKETFDLLSSDGGTIKIQDINTIFDLRVVGDSLYVFASNGVWAITGTNDGAFKATDYSVSKVSSFPAISKTSIVDVGGLPLWWNYEGIFGLQKSQVGLAAGDVTNLTQTTIQRYYDDIPHTSKLTAKGTFNDQQGLVYWLYNNTPSDGTYRYTDILVLDILSGAFYPLSVPVTNYTVSGLLAVRKVGPEYAQATVTNNALAIVTASAGTVTSSVQIGVTAQDKVFKFLVTTTGGNATFAEIGSESYVDWDGTAEEVSYNYGFTSGYRIRGDLLKNFQTNYLTVITDDIDNGSCYVQGVWDYSNSPDSGRYSNPQQVYRSRSLRDYQRSRLKMRGNGFSLQFKFFGESGKPFIITGWAGFETANTVP